MALLDQAQWEKAVRVGGAIGVTSLTLFGLVVSVGLSLFWLTQAGLAVTEASLRTALIGWAVASALTCGSLFWYLIRGRKYRLLLVLVALPFALVNIAVPLVLRLGQ